MCEYCEVKDNIIIGLTCGKTLLRHSKMVIYKNKITGKYYLSDNDGGEIEIISCPVCGEPLTEPKALELADIKRIDDSIGSPSFIKFLDGYDGKWADAWFVLPHDAYDKGFAFDDYGKTWIAYDYEPRKDADHD